MQKKVTPWFTLIYGAFIIVFGYVGYRGAGSVISLLFGFLFGGVAVGSAFALFANRKEGIYGALTSTALLTVAFIYRFATTKKSFSAFFAILSAAMLLFLLKNLKIFPRSDDKMSYINKR